MEGNLQKKKRGESGGERGRNSYPYLPGKNGNAAGREGMERQAFAEGKRGGRTRERTVPYFTLRGGENPSNQKGRVDNGTKGGEARCKIDEKKKKS